MPSSTDVRAGLVAALEADLVGPFAPGTAAGAAEELLPLPPSRWYLTGFLAPQADRETHDPTADDEFTQAGEDDDEESSPPELEPKQKNHFPASMGLSVLLPRPSGEPETIRATVTFAEYVREEQKTDDPRKRKVVWRRVPQPPRSVELSLDARAVEEGLPLPDTPGIQVCGKLEPADAPGLSGTRALSLFVVNRRQPGERGQQDAQFIFQVELELQYARGFVPRPNRQGEGAPDPDDRVADLQFRAHSEWAVGHGVAVEAPDGQRSVTTLRTTWIPRHEVRRVKTRKDGRVVTRMEELAKLAAQALEDGAAAEGRPGAAVAAALQPLVDAYAAWIGDQANIPLDSPRREETRKLLVIKQARRACARIQAGIDLLAHDRAVLEAFGLMNKAMAQAALQRSPGLYKDGERPTWHLFQLAFVLLNLIGIADETHEDREEVELIFFPTGGGKTEAYLGVIGFTLLLRRLRGQRRPDGGLGVAVLLRYTLRLLTLDQLGRAATLICALELIRKEHPQKLGQVRFAVGLWVGRSATANTLEQVKKLVIEYKNSSSKSASSPFPLTNCPWCGRRLGRDSLVLAPSRTAPEEVVVSCVTPSGEPPSDCAFNPRNNAEGLPVVFVDEQIYRELPSFLVATVDKFAMLPWRGETGMLFGRAAAREGKKFHGPMDRPPKGAVPLPTGLLPPELIVQDELHLIAGPLGTMVGLYETAIEHLSSRPGGATPVPPKVIASTATLRRAREQIRALFGREQMALFPPPGVDHAETFFATLADRTSPGRLYVGVAAPGRPQKAILLRTYVALLGAAQKQFDPRGADDPPADPYMTLAGYFNSLRELGGMRRLVEDDVRTRVATIEKRVPEGHEGPHPWAQNRAISMPVELTSREKAGAIKEAKDRLGAAHTAKEHVDVLLASNMISVGVDIDRLGLMVIAGQPKTTSEYIQASSRVGRRHPGLVVTCFNVRKPRDRSHYERFAAYHESFYRYVEATSLTPFSGPALDRGLTGTLVSMVRLADPAMTPAAAAMEIGARRALAEACVEVIAERAGRHTAQLEGEDHERAVDALRRRGRKVVETWEKLVHEARHEAAARRCYSPFDRDKAAGRPLLFSVTDDNAPDPNSPDGRFAAPTSMRDVEPSIHLWIERRSLGGKR
ncbi:DISARM system helicase DrmA [Sorangium sp. So ce854]|uniref:DISARM system helicase DrmA n=1 Tax=Sorangium sp. So ce854 TaxID=3133322 RepID=UPI003F61EDD5